MKLLTAAILGVSLLLGGCGTVKSVLEGGLSLTAPISQGYVSKSQLYKLENGFLVAFAGLNTYRRACLRGVADANCRANITLAQQYTRQVKPMLVQLRGYVRSGDQVSAMSLYGSLVALLSQVQGNLASVGVRA